MLVLRSGRQACPPMMAVAAAKREPCGAACDAGRRGGRGTNESRASRRAQDAPSRYGGSNGMRKRMAIRINPLHPLFAAEVFGVDLDIPSSRQPFGELKNAIDTYGVVAFRNDKPATDDQHVAFSRLFGPVEVGATFKISGDKKRIDNPALVDVGNLDADNNIMRSDNRRMLFRKGDRLWHADMSFMD